VHAIITTIATSTLTSTSVYTSDGVRSLWQGSLLLRETRDWWWWDSEKRTLRNDGSGGFLGLKALSEKER